jgi:hypothetical protein
MVALRRKGLDKVSDSRTSFTKPAEAPLMPTSRPWSKSTKVSCGQILWCRSFRRASGLHWDGVALVCTIRNEGMTITFVYKFDAEGHLRLAEELRGTDHDQDNLWIFDTDQCPDSAVASWRLRRPVEIAHGFSALPGRRTRA